MIKEPKTVRPKVTTKKAFMEGAALTYKLLKKHPEMSIHIEAHRYTNKPIHVRYWVYNYKRVIGVYATLEELEEAFKKAFEAPGP